MNIEKVTIREYLAVHLRRMGRLAWNKSKTALFKVRGLWWCDTCEKLHGWRTIRYVIDWKSSYCFPALAHLLDDAAQEVGKPVTDADIYRLMQDTTGIYLGAEDVKAAVLREFRRKYRKGGTRK